MVFFQNYHIITFLTKRLWVREVWLRDIWNQRLKKQNWIGQTVFDLSHRPVSASLVTAEPGQRGDGPGVAYSGVH